ncbi:MAG: DUF3990 domain-containing protein [Lactobacillus sp.]|nr:DUF3990 domain-containing protein [Lactobacillus sp.]
MMKLYHGSDMAVMMPDLSRCRQRHDFGKAFYLTKSFQQAFKWAKHRARLNQHSALPIVSCFEVDLSLFNDLKVKRFASPSPNWLEYVINNRNSCFETSNYDLVIGPMIDGRYSWEILRSYQKNQLSFDEAVQALRVNCFSDQRAFKSNLALKTLKFSSIRGEF